MINFPFFYVTWQPNASRVYPKIVLMIDCTAVRINEPMLQPRPKPHNVFDNKTNTGSYLRPMARNQDQQGSRPALI